MIDGADLIRLFAPADPVVTRAYLESAEFHTFVGMVARAAPGVLHTLAEEAMHHQDDLQRRINAIAHVPSVPLNLEDIDRGVE